MSLHREENIDSTENFNNLLDSINVIGEEYKMPIIISTHPRTKNKLKELNYTNKNDLIRFSKPYGFHEYNHLQLNAFCVISDSGTITEETSILNLPSITIRQAHERPEGMDETSVLMSGLCKKNILDCIKVTTTHHESDTSKIRHVRDYEADNVSKKFFD